MSDRKVMNANTMTRRRVLTIGGATAALAACGGSSDKETADTAASQGTTGTPTTGTTSTPTTGTTSTPTTGTTGGTPTTGPTGTTTGTGTTSTGTTGTGTTTTGTSSTGTVTTTTTTGVTGTTGGTITGTATTPAFCATSDASGASDTHSHVLMISMVDLLAARGGTYMSGGGSHSHAVVISDEEMATLRDTCEVTITSDDTHPHVWVLTA